MVRHKTRWFLVRLDFEKHMTTTCQDDNKSNEKSSDPPFPSRKEVTSGIRESILTCFGTAAGGAALDIQGKVV